MVPAVNPVGNAPVVVKTTGVPAGGATAVVITAGLAIVIVAVADGLISRLLAATCGVITVLFLVVSSI